MSIDSLLAAPAAEGVRARALELLEAARAARARLEDVDDGEAVHDLRVALRRLRSVLRAHAGLLGKKVKKLRGQLGQIAGATGAARDAEVQLAWLAKQPRAGRLVTRVEQRRDEGYAEARATAGPAFDALEPRLRRALSSYRVEVGRSGRTFGAELAELLVPAARELGERLGSVRSPDDHDAVHRARIAGKRLRYLLEPLADRAPGALETLARLQDALGELHDAHVLAPLVARSPALAARLRKHRDGRYRAVVRARGATLRVIEELGELAAELAGGEEIERKFLLSGMPSVAHERALDIEQGYLPGSRLVERLRTIRDGDGKVTRIRGMKLGAGVRRIEVEEECPEDLFRKLWPLTRGKRIRKRRFEVKDGELTWEIDLFHGRDLVLAEIELPAEDTPVTPPAWLEGLIVREVTGEKEFTNAALAR